MNQPAAGGLCATHTRPHDGMARPVNRAFFRRPVSLRRTHRDKATTKRCLSARWLVRRARVAVAAVPPSLPPSPFAAGESSVFSLFFSLARARAPRPPPPAGASRRGSKGGGGGQVQTGSQAYIQGGSQAGRASQTSKVGSDFHPCGGCCVQGGNIGVAWQHRAPARTGGRCSWPS